MAEITERARMMRQRTAKVRRYFLDLELDDLEREMDMPGGAAYVRRIRRLVNKGDYLEAGYQILHPPFVWDGGEGYHVCGEWQLLQRLIYTGRAAERANGHDG